MGPVRRRLIAAALLLQPSMAWAQACAQQRPTWDGMPVSAFSEMIALLQTPMALILILATALVIRFRSQWGGVAVVLGWSTMCYLLISDAITGAAAAEGCVGSPSLFIGVVAAACVGVVLYTAPLRKATKE